MSTARINTGKTNVVTDDNQRLQLVLEFLGKYMSILISSIIIIGLLTVLGITAKENVIEKAWPYITPLITLFAGVLAGGRRP